MRRKRSDYAQRLYNLRAELDGLWQRRVSPEGTKCELCDKPAYCGHHIVSKAASTRLRWEPRNGVRVCWACHQKIHKGQVVACRRLFEAVGDIRLDELLELAGKPVHLTVEKAEEIRERLTDG